MRSFLALALTAALGVQAQTYTSCNPTERTDCPADLALGKTLDLDFTKGASDYFNTTGTGTITYDGTTGLNLQMDKQGDAPTLSSNFYIFFGKVEVVLKGAPGTGIITSLVLQSDDLDEIDWEWFGTDTTQVESNYFGKGNTTTYDRAQYHNMPGNPITDWFTYTIEWTQESVVWSINGTAYRTLNYADALNGENFPQTPMQVKLGIWAGGDPNNEEGTIEWAGGETNYNDAPFAMQVKSLYVEDYSYGKEYIWTDTSGSYESIEVSNSTDKTAVVQNSSGGLNSTGIANGTNATGTMNGSSATASVEASNDAAFAPRRHMALSAVVLAAMAFFAC